MTTIQDNDVDHPLEEMELDGGAASSSLTDDLYNPFQHREIENPTSDLDTLVHLLKGSLGCGLLSMPLAFSNAGLGLGLFGIFVIGAICTYSVHILIKSSHTLCQRRRIPSLGFAEVAEAAFFSGPEYLKKLAPAVKATINIFLAINMFFSSCVYIVFVSQNMKQIIDRHTGSDFDLRYYMVALLPLLILINCIRNLKYLAPFSVIANLLIATGMIVTCSYIFVDLPSLSERSVIVNWTKWPMFFGTSIFALEGIGVVMPLENNMQNPTHFIGKFGVLNIGMFLIVLLYAFIGFFGYLKYGDATQTSISLNLDETDVLAQTVKGMIAAAIYFSYALQFYVLMDVVWKKLKPYCGERKLIEYTARIIIIIATVVMAILISNFKGFISLVGAVCLSTLGLIFPAIIDLVTFYEDPGLGRFNWRLWVDSFLIVFGFLGFISGSYISIAEIVNSEQFT